MNFKSLNEYVKFNRELELYDLIAPTFIYLDVNNLPIQMYAMEVTKENEMRIDLVFKDMYNFESNDASVLYEDMDIILYINNIDNPLTIKEGLTLYYPGLDDLSKFRLSPSYNDESKLSTREKLVVPNKTTRKDKNREDFKNNNYSLPPVVLETPRAPVTISNGKFSIGGL